MPPDICFRCSGEDVFALGAVGRINGSLERW